MFLLIYLIYNPPFLVKDELSHLKKVLDSENRLLVTELEDLQTKSNKEPPMTPTPTSSRNPAHENLRTTTPRRSLSMIDDDFTPPDLSTSIEPYIAALPINAKANDNDDMNDTTKMTAGSGKTSSITPSTSSPSTPHSTPSSSKNNRSVRFSQQLTDVWSQSRIRGRKLDMGKRRGKQQQKKGNDLI